jgi:hypothetical protein
MMKAFILSIFLCLAFMANAQRVITSSLSSSVGGASTDTTTLLTDWSYVFAFSGTGSWISEVQHNVTKVSGTANNTFYVEKSFDYVNWVHVDSIQHTTDTDTLVYFSDTTTWPYLRYRTSAISGAQVLKNKLYFSLVKQ